MSNALPRASLLITVFSPQLKSSLAHFTHPSRKFYGDQKLQHLALIFNTSRILRALVSK